MRFSIRYQLLLPLSALMLGLVGVSAWSAWASGQRARRQIDQQIVDIKKTVNAASYPLNARTLNLMKGLSGAEFVLRDDGGQKITTLPQVPDALPSPTESARHHFDQPVSIGGVSYLCGGVPLTHGVPAGTVLYILYPESLWHEAAWEALRPALWLSGVGGMVAVLLSVLLTQTLTWRIQELERRTRLIASGDFSPMPLPSRDDELRDLSRSVNEMAERLARFQDTIRQTERLRLLGQVSGGLAHQLRNGAAGARLAVQLHSQECTASSDQESLTVALRQLSLVEMHLKKFLDLGKSLELNRQSSDLSQIILDTLDLLGPQCRHAHIDLRVRAPKLGSTANATIYVDPTQVGHLLLNVVTNAIEAAGPDGWVEVSWQSVAAFQVVIEVRDSGPGPSPDVAQRLFEPFVTGKREGVGLGLAVARQIAEAHGGIICWQRESASTCFRIELPTDQGPSDATSEVGV